MASPGGSWASPVFVDGAAGAAQVAAALRQTVRDALADAVAPFPMAVHGIPLASKGAPSIDRHRRRGNVFTVLTPPPQQQQMCPWKVRTAEVLSDAELLATEPDTDSFRKVVDHLVSVSNYFGVLPAPRGAVLQFRWRSLRVFISLVVACLFLWRIGIYFYCIYIGYNTVLEVIVTTRIGFHVMATLEVALYVGLAYRWRPFVLCFLRVEHRYSREDGAPAALRKRLVALAAGVLSMTVLEIMLELFTFPLSREMDQFESLGQLLEDYYNRLFNQVAQAFPYSPMGLVVSQFTVAATNLVLNFNDLFLTTVSFVIVHRFQELRARISKDVQKVGGFLYWKMARENFDDLSRLTRHADHYLNSLMLLSCLNNFFSICIQLQHTVRPSSATPGIIRQLYFCYSFAFVLLRSGTTVYAASSIPEESKALKRVLYSVSSEHFSEEIGRFLAQVTTDDINLTGLGMFTITRSFILTMLGTIATYEILLVQMYKSDAPS